MTNCGICYWRNPDSGYCPKKGVEMEPYEGTSCVNFQDRDEAVALATMTASTYAGCDDTARHPKRGPEPKNNELLKNLKNTKKMEQMKTCKQCGKMLPLSEFPAFKSSKDGHSTFCKDCDHARRVNAHKVRAASAQAKKAEQEQGGVAVKVEKKVSFTKERLARFTSAELVTELRRRGYEVSATRTVTETL